jgi:hypothetical protein
VISWQQERLRAQELDDRRRKLLEAKALELQQHEAKNWVETQRLNDERSNVENQLTIMKRDWGLMEKKSQHLRSLEDQRRRNRQGLPFQGHGQHFTHS